MVNTAYFSGLRPSELNALKIDHVLEEALRVDETCSRGCWKQTKTDPSSATISVPHAVIARICRLKDIEVEYRAGDNGSKRRVKCIRDLRPDALVFQPLQNGGAMNDRNIRRRHIRPAALKLGIDS